MNIDNYLYYGYDPDCSQAGLSKDIIDAAHRDLLSEDYDSLIDRGQNVLRCAVNSELERVEGRDKHVVPLSAGLDSRAILAVLLENTKVDNESITTVSFGTPGTWDFEIGQYVASVAGVDNITIDLTSERFDWSEKSLRNYAKTLDCPTRVFEGYVNYNIKRYVKEDTVIWSGFLGDPTVGSHQPENPSDNWTSACEHFIDYNRYSSILSNQISDPIDALPNKPYLQRNQLSYEEQLDFAHRQQCFIAPLILYNGGTYATPFAQPQWLKYSLNLPPKYRKNRSMYVDIITKMYPELFSIPSDMKHGLPPTTGKIRWYFQLGQLYTKLKLSDIMGVEYTYPGTNYLDFESALREPGEIRTTIKSLVEKFDDRNIRNVNSIKIWNCHQDGSNREKALRTICSLELLIGE